jgi:hypothetical protein
MTKFEVCLTNQGICVKNNADNVVAFFSLNGEFWRLTTLERFYDLQENCINFVTDKLNGFEWPIITGWLLNDKKTVYDEITTNDGKFYCNVEYSTYIYTRKVNGEIQFGILDVQRKKSDFAFCEITGNHCDRSKLSFLSTPCGELLLAVIPFNDVESKIKMHWQKQPQRNKRTDR